MPTPNTAKQAIQRLVRPKRDPLPADFLFGVGTSDHQCEAFDPRFPDVWDDWEARHPLRHPGKACCQARGRATDFWNRYPEDVELARRLGAKAFRFSIAWARVEPEPGRFSQEALDHYRRLADTIVAAGMEPIVTLMHFVWPRHVEERGGLRAPSFPEWFGAYTARVRDAIGDRARHWITINEPNALVFGYLKPFWMQDYAWPPGLPPSADDDESMQATAEVIRNLFKANREARRILRSGPGGERRLVSANGYYLGLPDRFWRVPFPLMHLVDWRARSEKGWNEEEWVLREGRIVARPSRAENRLLTLLARGGRLPLLRPLGRVLADLHRFGAMFSFVAANWWHLGMRGDLPTFLCPPDCRDQQDYVAFDYYFGTPLLVQIGTLMEVLERRYDHAPIWPAGLYGALRYFKDLFPDKPVFIIENGVAAERGDRKRARYLRDHVREVQHARQDGVNVIGHLAWSLTTNREWGLPTGAHGDFGLYHVDLDRDPELARRSTHAALAYCTIIRRRGA